MKNILVTGGCGFIGSNFLKTFLGKYKNYRVINLDALTYAGNLENLKEISEFENYHFVKGSINDTILVEKLFKEYKVDTVINFAAESHVDRSILGSKVFMDTNILGTHNLLEISLKYKVERFLQISTDEVYGSLKEDGLFKEDSPIKPNSPYSSSKASADLIARSYFKTYNLPVLVTRCSNNYGPYQFPEKLIPLVISNCLERKELPVYGDGKNVRDWIFVEDHVEAIDKVLHNGTHGEVYNIGASEEWQNINIVTLICTCLEKKLKIKNGELKNLIKMVKDRPGHDRRYAIDSSKMKKELNWEPKVKFEEGIEKTISWYMENEKWTSNIKSGEYKTYYEKHYKHRDKTF